MTPTAHDYAWLADSRWFAVCLQDGYSLSLVRGRTPQQALESIGAVPQGFGDGADDLFDCQEELREWVDDDQDSSFAVGAVAVPGTGGDWTLLLALDGGGGMLRHLAALSRGGAAVTHDSNGGKPLHMFHHHLDGELRTAFEHPASANGSDPHALDAPLHEIGHRDTADTLERKAVVFALSERLTGVRITEETVRDAEFVLGVVPDEDDTD
ncbi:DUF6461 domain-containing protein [Kitasatospora griseola]|uniref:DUF6461 domain-containing protein n=1 Tax=Kitasatospora griseola TaxID=2064 RepID=UPI00382885C6